MCQSLDGVGFASLVCRSNLVGLGFVTTVRDSVYHRFGTVDGLSFAFFSGLSFGTWTFRLQGLSLPQRLGFGFRICACHSFSDFGLTSSFERLKVCHLGPAGFGVCHASPVDGVLLLSRSRVCHLDPFLAVPCFRGGGFC